MRARRPWIRWLPLATLVVVTIAVVSVLRAETPFGIGDGVVPTATGRSVCDATNAIVERGLRYRYLGERAVHERAAKHAPKGTSPDLCAAPVVDQSPRAGTHLRERAVVTIRSACQGPRGTPVGGGCG